MTRLRCVFTVVVVYCLGPRMEGGSASMVEPHTHGGDGRGPPLPGPSRLGRRTTPTPHRRRNNQRKQEKIEKRDHLLPPDRTSRSGGRPGRVRPVWVDPTPLFTRSGPKRARLGPWAEHGPVSSQPVQSRLPAGRARRRSVIIPEPVAQHCIDCSEHTEQRREGRAAAAAAASSMASSLLTVCRVVGLAQKPNPSKRGMRAASMEMGGGDGGVSYQTFVSFALEETQRHTHLVSSPLQIEESYDMAKRAWARVVKYRLEITGLFLLCQSIEDTLFSKDKYNHIKSMDGKSDLKMLSYKASKIRLLRSLCIEGGESMKVLDFAVFPEPAFDLPIFCANFFSAATINIVVLSLKLVLIVYRDLNPLHDIMAHKDYKEKYYRDLLPLGLKYAERLPWGGKLTSESIRFFSPIVIWTKFVPGQDKYDVLYSAFVDYYRSWLKLMDLASPEKEDARIILTGSTTQDPGHQVLKRLIGETRAKDLVWDFLFSGVDTLGSKTFLDYFPDYCCKDGKINEKRSMIGKSFETRPWDTGGNLIDK
ncbi:hypothetical protein Syun_017698 [Stephania yunnanensis]|uniref:Uncharacterized protein n=1 Tax=Stephania yunnanensis TaxID=152371 RepID=A0AAP0J7I6_9MAGN